MTRTPCLAAVCLLAASSVFGAESLQLDASESLFCVLAAANAAGYDEGLNLPDNSPLRRQLRDYLGQQNIAVLPELKAYYRKHMAKPGPQAGVQDLSQYISYAMSVAGPPDFAWKGRDVEVPPDAVALNGFTSLMSQFYQQAHLDELWQKVRPSYEKEIERYHTPLLSMTTAVDGYLRVSASGYLGRRFQVFVELLAAPQQVQTRNYGDDALVIVTPSPEPRMFDIRHAYLHFQIDPIMIKYGMDLQQKRSLMDLIQLSPLDDNYKSDFVLLSNECLIKAVESRLDKNPAEVGQSMRQGYILTQYFADQLPVFEKQQQGMRFYAEDMINSIDLKRETARISAIKFDAGQLRRQGKQVTVAGPELSPSAKTLEKAEDLYTTKNLDGARELFLKSLEERGSPEEHASAWYGLGRIALLQKQPDAAVKLFEKTLGASPDAFTKGWTLVYMARLSIASGDSGRALKLYQEALAVPGASERTVEAARKESQNIPKSNSTQENPK
ncbi:MAG: tetratricopeptide repeat protein [Acidobacteriota bacterium]|nr:tetratricopeptide repeat protein [Acidobacteriota bacterium]